MNATSKVFVKKSRLRQALVIASILFILIGVTALLYVFWPAPLEQARQMLSPNLFTPP